MRAELVKIEAQYEKIRTEKAGINSKFPSMEGLELGNKVTELLGEKLKR